MKITIIIPNFLQMECAKTSIYPYMEHFEHMDITVRSATAQDYKDKEILIMHGKQKDGFESYNECVKKAKGDIIFFLCPEASFSTNNELSKLMKLFEDKNIDAVACSSYANYYDNFFHFLICKEYEERESMIREGFVDVGSTSYFAVRKQAFLDAGGFSNPTMHTKNEWFNTGFRDWDFCQQFVAKGYKIWHTNKVNIYHQYQTTFFGYLKKQYHQSRYRVSYWRRFHIIKDDYTHNGVIVPPVIKMMREGKYYAMFLIPLAFVRYTAWVMGIIRGVFDI